ncbi:MAG: bifunctional adenosylcobinamide kinase/adenosylcobinamide-phosphate guanylyltransferase [Dehalococcoidia bacterium]
MLTLILGGARSGKSDMAQRLAVASGRDVLVVATMEPRDDEMTARIAAHRAARPAGWRTLEEPRDVMGHLPSLAPPGGFVVFDCLTMWVANMLLERFPVPEDLLPGMVDAGVSEIAGRVEEFAAWAAAYEAEIAVVSNEVGMGVVPPYPLGRMFRDALGAANAMVAGRADRAYLLVAGLAVDLKALGARPVETFGKAPGR